MFLRKNWLPLLLFVMMICAVSLYILTTQAHKEPIKTHKPVEVSNPANPKPPPPGETAESGHWHGDEWHAEPHEAHAPVQHVEVAEVKAERFVTPHAALTEAQDKRDMAEIVERFAQSGVPMKKFSHRTQEYHEAFETWSAWEDKHIELRKEYGQASQEMLDAMPGTEEDAKRYIADENYKKEVQRKMQEAMDKSAEILRRQREHAAKRPSLPYIP